EERRGDALEVAEGPLALARAAGAAANAREGFRRGGGIGEEPGGGGERRRRALLEIGIGEEPRLRSGGLRRPAGLLPEEGVEGVGDGGAVGGEGLVEGGGVAAESHRVGDHRPLGPVLRKGAAA